MKKFLKVKVFERVQS